MNRGERAVMAAVLCLGLMLAALKPVAAAERALSTPEWREDLEFVVSALRTRHPDPYYKISPAEFEAAVAASREEIARAASDLECYFAICRVIAVIEDGHTGLWGDGVFDLLDLRFPFRVDEFTDGVYITSIRREDEAFLGSRLTAVGGVPIATALATIEKVASADNRFWRRAWALNGISLARVLFGLGILDGPDAIELTLVSKDGKPGRLVLPAVGGDGPLEWGWNLPLNVGPTAGEYVNPSVTLGGAAPLFFKDQGKAAPYYWYEPLAGDRAIYLQLNQVADQPDRDETFARFSARLWDHLDRNAGDIDKLIIDLRHNSGGNGMLILPFLNEIIKRDHINRADRLFVISGKKTYSAASVFLNELAVHTRARFIGEPDGCGSDLFSNNRLAGRLPHSGFPLWVARLHFTSRWPGGNEEYFMPQVPAPFSSRDYFSGRDPALELALHGDPRSVAEYAADHDAEAALAFYREQKERYKDIDWWTALSPERLERDVNRKGYDLIANGDLGKALRVLTFNTLLFPDSSNAWDSLGEVHYHLKDYDLALRCYERSVALDADNEGGRRMIESLKKLKSGPAAAAAGSNGQGARFR